MEVRSSFLIYLFSTFFTYNNNVVIKLVINFTSTQNFNSKVARFAAHPAQITLYALCESKITLFWYLCDSANLG